MVEPDKLNGWGGFRVVLKKDKKKRALFTVLGWSNRDPVYP
jgi:hypothetical protein